MVKTNVMKALEKNKIDYKGYTYGDGGAISGTEVAELLGFSVEKVFKTLVTVGKSGKNYVFMVPVAKELDLKKAASFVKEKSIEMIKSKELLPLTGYIHGGCSPIGMKKVFPITIDETAEICDTVVFSAGKIGYQVELTLENLQKMVTLQSADIVVD